MDKNKTVEELKNTYKVKQVIGKGGYASVRLAVHRQTKIKVAIKVVQKKRMSEADLLGFQNEVAFLSEIDHPNVVQVLDIYEDEKNFCLILERLEGGGLDDQLSTREPLVEAEIHRLITVS